MEIALLLFGITILVNIAAQLLVWRVSRQGGGEHARRHRARELRFRSDLRLRRRRNRTNRVMLTLTGVAAVLVVIPLLLIFYT
jgi:hypothetical protein